MSRIFPHDCRYSAFTKGEKNNNKVPLEIFHFNCKCIGRECISKHRRSEMGTMGVLFKWVSTLSLIILTSAAQSDLDKLSIANNAFGLKLYKELSSSTSANVLISPLSISTVLSMLFYGTRGTTEEEMSTVLGYKEANMSREEVAKTFSGFARSYLKDNKDYTLSAANAILVDEHLRLMDNYRTDIQNAYQASVRNVNFARDSVNVVNEINSWVRRMTRGKISELLTNLHPSTVMVLLNAIYFKGTWVTKFDPQKTIDQTFYNSGQDSLKKGVRMMHQKSKQLYTQEPGFKALELPYLGNDTSMLILLPDSVNGLREMEEHLTLDKLSSIRRKMRKVKVTIGLPKFKLGYEKELSQPIANLGASSIFRNGGDFSRMVHDDTDLRVSKIIHKAVIEINEEGSEAAAVTGVVILKISLRPNEYIFIADHPFVFAIIQRLTGMILFMGRVNNL